MDHRAPIDRVPARVRAYLLEWRNAHNEEYLTRFDRRPFRELTIYEIEKLFREAIDADKTAVGFVMQEIETEQSRPQ